MSLLDVSGLSIGYGSAPAVDRVSFSIDRRESVGLVGESGSGKSQTALALLGLLPPGASVTGSVRLDGVELLQASGRVLDQVRARRVAMVFQDPAQALNPHLRIGSQLSRILRRHDRAGKAAARRAVTEMLARVGLPDPEHQYRAYPHELSGGMRQRAMIASALLLRPDLLIADEPTTALDVTVQAQILDLLDELRQDTSLLLITHDLGVIAGRCERMLVLERGKLVESGFTRKVFAAPQHEHTAVLIDAALTLQGEPAAARAGGEELLAVEGAAVTYRPGTRHALAAVRDVGLQLRAGETVAVVGESGSGKTSLARAVLGLVPMAAGRVVFCGTSLPPGLQHRRRSTLRELQLIFQDPAASLDPQMRVVDSVAEPLWVHEPGLAAAERRQRAAAMLASTGLGEQYLERYPHELSGGQAQRVAIARALVLEPKVLVCDEAVAALDGTVRGQVLRLLQEIQRATGLAIIFITHDLAVVRAVSHRVLVMYLGRLVETAPNEALFTAPQHPYTRALLEAVPNPDPANPGGRASVSGEVPSALLPPDGCAFHPRCRYARARCRTEPPQLRRLLDATVSCHFAGQLDDAAGAEPG